MTSPDPAPRRLGGEFGRFLVVGGAGTILNMAIFVLCTDVFGAHYIPASVVAFVCAVTSNYYWNRRWTFRWRGRQDIAKKYVRFVIASLVALGVNVLLLHLCVRLLGANPKVGQLAGIAAGTLFNFAGSKLWVFAAERTRT